MKKYIAITLVLIVLLALAFAIVNSQLPVMVDIFTLTGPALRVQPAVKIEGLPAPGHIYVPSRNPQYRLPNNAECLRKCA
jgi:hypothetical protein